MLSFCNSVSVCKNRDVLFQRRRDEEDELLMREYLSEGDLISVYFCSLARLITLRHLV